MSETMIGTQLAEEAASPDDCIRREAAKQLKNAGLGALPFLARLVKDPNDFIRMEAKASVYALAKEYGDKEQGGLEAARLGMQAAWDQNLVVRLSAWAGLKQLPRELLAKAYAAPVPEPGYGIDCLNRNQVPIKDGPIQCHLCIAILATPGFEHLMDMCLQSLKKNGGLEGHDYTVVAFMPGADQACRDVCRRYGAVCLEPLSLVAPHASMKGMIYSLHRWVDAKCYLSLEPDMLVIGSLANIVDQVLADREDRLFAVPSLVTLNARDHALRETGRWEPEKDGFLQTFITNCFAGDGDDVKFLLGDREPQTRVFCNGGLFLGNREALRRVEEQILSLQPFASLWIDTGHVHWREEMVWNIAYNLAGNIAPLPKSYNHELPAQESGLFYDADADEYGPAPFPHPVHVLHFMGAMKEQMPRYMEAYGMED